LLTVISRNLRCRTPCWAYSSHERFDFRRRRRSRVWRTCRPICWNWTKSTSSRAFH